MISYEIYSYNSIISVILYTTSNIYHLHKPLFMIVLHYIIFVVHIQLQGHISTVARHHPLLKIVHVSSGKLNISQ